MTNSLQIVLEIIIGLGAGLAVGGAFIAFLAVLRIIPRLIQLSHSFNYIKIYEACVILGTLFGTFMSFTSIHLEQTIILLMIWGLLQGIFNGMLAAALTEVLNVFPVIAKRIKLNKYIRLLLIAIVLGKVSGSLFQWLFFVK